MNPLPDVEKLTALFDTIGNLCAPKKSAKKKQKNILENFQLPILSRTKLLDKLNTSKSRIQEHIFSEAKQRDEIAKEYQHQHVVAVNLPKLGTQSASYAHLNAKPHNIISKFLMPSIPIVIIGGLSNDIDPLAYLGQEAALTNREVIILSYPESVNGSVSSSFADAVGKDKPFSTHALFFEAAISQLLDGHDIEIWGYSTGCAIAAEMLTHQNFSKKVTRAVLICPAASTNQSKLQMITGLAHEAGKGIQYFNLLPNYSLVLPNQSQADTRKRKIFAQLFEQITHQSDAYFKAKVKENGSIIIVSAQDDQITKSFLAEDELQKNPQIRVLKLEKGLHMDPIIHAEETVKMILAEEE